MLGVVALALGDQHSMILMADGSVYTAGYNKYGQLGQSSNVNSLEFLCTVTDSAEAVAVGSHHSMTAVSGSQVGTSMVSWGMGRRLTGMVL